MSSKIMQRYAKPNLRVVPIETAHLGSQMAPEGSVYAVQKYLEFINKPTNPFAHQLALKDPKSPLSRLLTEVRQVVWTEEELEIISTLEAIAKHQTQANQEKFDNAKEDYRKEKREAQYRTQEPNANSSEPASPNTLLDLSLLNAGLGLVKLLQSLSSLLRRWLKGSLKEKNDEQDDAANELSPLQAEGLFSKRHRHRLMPMPAPRTRSRDELEEEARRLAYQHARPSSRRRSP